MRFLLYSFFPYLTFLVIKMKVLNDKAIEEWYDWRFLWTQKTWTYETSENQIVNFILHSLTDCKGIFASHDAGEQRTYR